MLQSETLTSDVLNMSSVKDYKDSLASSIEESIGTPPKPVKLSLKVLIVNDDELIQVMLKTMLITVSKIDESCIVTA